MKGETGRRNYRDLGSIGGMPHAVSYVRYESTLYCTPCVPSGNTSTIVLLQTRSAPFCASRGNALSHPTDFRGGEIKKQEMKRREKKHDMK